MYLQPKDCNIIFSLDLSTTSLVTVICFTISNDATTELHSEKLDIFVMPPITNKLRLLKVYNVISLLPGRGHCFAFLGKTLCSHDPTLHPGVLIDTGEHTAGGIPTID